MNNNTYSIKNIEFICLETGTKLNYAKIANTTAGFLLSEFYSKKILVFFDLTYKSFMEFSYENNPSITNA